MIRCCLLVWFSALLWSYLAVVTVESAHSRRRVVRVSSPRERYDRSITTFDPNGRLLQVEYGMHASSRGSPILCVIQEKPTPKIYVALHHESSTPQVHRLDDHVFLFGTGLVGDTLFLTNYLRQWCQQHRMEMGEAPTVREIAEQVSSIQHTLTRAGGQRLLGCTVAVVGVDPIHMPSQLARRNEKVVEDNTRQNLPADILRLYRCGPGGTLEDCLYCALGKHQDSLMKRMRSEYPKLCYDGDDAMPTEGDESVAHKLANFMRATTETAGGQDVWEIVPALGRRGNVKASCRVDI